MTRYLTTSELQAKFCGRSRSSIWRDVRDGRLPKPIKLGTVPYWRDSDIDAAMEQLEAAQASQQ